MRKNVLLLGSIGVLAETSDIQRQAYNAAFQRVGLSWHWDRARYRGLLKESGGKNRLERLATEGDSGLNQTQIDEIHRIKTEVACHRIIQDGVPLRPGVAYLIRRALDAGMRLGLVTTTYRPNIDAIAQAAADNLPLDAFAVVTTRDDVSRTKPDPEVYRFALAQLGARAEAAVAIEDTALSLAAAKAAGIATIATPGALTDDQDFSVADLVVDKLATEAGALDPAVERLVFG